MTMHRIGALVITATLGLGLGACGDDGDDTSADETTAFTGECEEFTQAFVNAGQAIGSALTGAETDFEEVAEYFNEVTDQLPEEIQDDFSVFAEAYTTYAEALADADIDFSNPAADPEALAELQELSEAFSDSEVQEASNNIQAYISENCTAGS